MEFRPAHGHLTRLETAARDVCLLDALPQSHIERNQICGIFSKLAEIFAPLISAKAALLLASNLYNNLGGLSDQCPLGSCGLRPIDLKNSRTRFGHK